MPLSVELGDFVSSDGENLQSETTTEGSYIYVSSVDDLKIGDSTMLGMLAIGSGMFISLTVVLVISWMRRG